VVVYDVDNDGDDPPADPGALPVSGALSDLTARIAVDVQSCSLIAGLHGGPLNRIVTLTAAGRLVGVRVEGDVVEVGVVGWAGADPGRLVDQVRAAVTACAPRARVDVSIAAGLDRTGVVVHGELPG
jgi:hypothetical protein